MILIFKEKMIRDLKGLNCRELTQVEFLFYEKNSWVSFSSLKRLDGLLLASLFSLSFFFAFMKPSDAVY